jgi:transposase
MSLKIQAVPEVPVETARIAKAAFRKGNPWLQLRDALGTVYQDAEFSELFAERGQPSIAPWRLALTSIAQFAEGLTDRQAADAVCSRLDLKYLLSLEPDDPGFDASVLCEFRKRLISGDSEALLLNKLLEICRERKLLKGRGTGRTDSTHMLAAIRVLNRLENVALTLQHALNILATVAPDWVLAHCPPEWGEQYGARIDNYRLPKSDADRRAYAEQVGSDGHQLLSAIYADDKNQWLQQVPAIETLRRVWVQQFCRVEQQWRWRDPKKHGVPPSAVMIQSPIDPEARYAEKRGQGWTGYKVHLTENCDPDHPRLITDVTTTVATTPDVEALDQIQEQLAAKDCLPQSHVVDAGYVSASNLVQSEIRYGIELCGPPLKDTTWQARAGKGFAASNFQIDWVKEQAICPAGRQSVSWNQTINSRGQDEIKIKFARGDCRGCHLREQCTRTAEQRRNLTILPEAEFRALEKARQRTQTPEYRELYAARSGSEASVSQAARRSGIRRARYIGIAKAHLQNVLTAVALNFVRLLNWLGGTTPAQARKSAVHNLLCPLPVTS